MPIEKSNGRRERGWSFDCDTSGVPRVTSIPALSAAESRGIFQEILASLAERRGHYRGNVFIVDGSTSVGPSLALIGMLGSVDTKVHVSPSGLSWTRHDYTETRSLFPMVRCMLHRNRRREISWNVLSPHVGVSNGTRKGRFETEYNYWDDREMVISSNAFQ